MFKVGDIVEVITEFELKEIATRKDNDGNYFLDGGFKFVADTKIKEPMSELYGKQVKIKETEELLKFEPYKQYLSKLEQELMWNAREEREKNLCLYLMKKYHPTVLIRDDLPF